MSARPALGRLWAPWRMTYLRQSSTACLFCRVARSRTDRANLVIARRAHAYLMLNRFPYTGGHLMAVVHAHRARFADLDAAERTDLVDLIALAERLLETEYRPQGMNLGVNVGHVAGAGYPGHLHVHVVPRWNGDTNFMATVGETRVLPESLAQTWTRLRRAIARVEGPPARRRRRGAKS